MSRSFKNVFLQSFSLLEHFSFHIRVHCKESSPHPLLLVLCVCEQLPDVGLRLSDVLVEDLGAVDDLWLTGF